MKEAWKRTAALIGAAAVEQLEHRSVILLGLGGVGSFACEVLARSGIGRLTLVDPDRVDATNLNRQLPALHSTLGEYKANVMARRVLDINPAAWVEPLIRFYGPETAAEFNLESYDYIVDCIDTVTSKLLLAQEAQRLKVPIISSMGTGNKLDPSQLEIADLFQTSVCPLARVMRRECRSRGIERLTVVYSKEQPIAPSNLDQTKGKAGRPAPGSSPLVPPAAGILIASRVVTDLMRRADG